MARRRFRARWAMGALLAMAGCGGPVERPDILFVSIDTLRADRIGAYGHGPAATPVMDRLAREGVRYASCQSPVPVTLPSHASMMTGLYPPEHGVRNNASYRLPEHIPTLAEELGAAGYATGAFVAALPLAPRFGLDRGFEAYDASLPEDRSDLFSFRERPATEVVRSALDWIRGAATEQPLFVFTHFFEPHAPYEAAQPAGVDAYDAEVAAADRALGLLIEQMTSLRGKAPMIVLTSDHGEGLGEHGESTHAIYLYQTTLHVPLILSAPGRWPEGVVVEEPVSLIDLAPTLLAELKIEPQRMRPTGEALRVGEEPARRPLYSESVYGLEAYRWAPLFASLDGTHKAIRSRRSWAFDLKADPGELRDLLEISDWSAAQLEALDGKIESYARLEVAAGREPTPEELEALSALGYVGGTTGGDAPELLLAMAELPDATERQGEFDRTHRAEQLIGNAEYEAATAELRGVLEANPDNVWAHMLLGQALGSDGRDEEALRSYERAVALRPDWLDAHRSIARLHSRSDAVDAALAAYAEALRIDPTDVDLRLEAAALLQKGDRLEEAETLLRAGLNASGPAAIEAGLARVCFQRGRLDEGRRHLERARAAADDSSLRLLAANYARRASQWEEILVVLGNEEEWEGSAEGQQLRGEARQRLGDVDAAVQFYEKALLLDPELHLARNNLAWALATGLGRPGEALAHAERAIELLPQEIEYHDTYLEVLIRLQRNEAAADHLRALLATHPDNETLQRRAAELNLR